MSGHGRPYVVLSALAAAGVLTAAPVARAQPEAVRREAAELLAALGSDDRVSKTYAALSLHRIARESWRLTLFDDTALRPWQRLVAPAAPPLVAMLADDGPLEWINAASGATVVEQATTPRREAARALLALERPSVEPLIAAVDRKIVGPRADALLRTLTGGGPAARTTAAWTDWWRENAARPLRNERGQGWIVAGLLVILVAGAALVVRLQRAGAARRRSLARDLAPPAAG